MGDEPRLRVLVPGEEELVDAFLARHADASMILRSNLRRAGLLDRGQPFQATHVGLFDADGLAGLAAHASTGMLMLQASVATVALARATVLASRRLVTGLIGPWAQVAAVAAIISSKVQMRSREILLALDLDALQAPPPLVRGQWHCRWPRASELDLVAEWSVGYQLEALGAPDGAPLLRGCRAHVARLQAEGCQWLLEVDGRPVAYCAFNATLPDRVQPGGVWTPRELRGRGYGRGVVAGALAAARAQGVGRAVLFTGETNLPAQHAYASLGFAPVGDYGVVLYP
jgi:uncharacterized protein